MSVNKDQLGAFIFLLFSIAYGYYAQQIPMYPGDEYEPFTARSLPQILAVFGGLISALMLVMVTFKPASNQAFEVKKVANWRPVLMLLGLMLGYAFSLEWFGFVIATTAFLLAGVWLLGERRIKVLWWSSLPFVLGFWALLTQALDVYLEPGKFWTLVVGG